MDPKLNDLFLEFNRQQRQSFIQKSPVIILLINDILHTYVHGNKVMISHLGLKRYHTLKNITHYLIYILSSSQSERETENTKLSQELLKYLVQDEIMYENLNVSKILSKVIQNTTNNTTNNSENSNEWMKLVLKMCAEMYSSELHYNVQKIKEHIVQSQSEDAWNKLIVCVSGPPSPRPGHSAMQYFTRLVGSASLSEDPSFSPLFDDDEKNTKKNRKLHYIENVYDCDKVLDIMAQLEIERLLFDKIIPMKTDIMALDTQQYLKKVCGK
jgi:hypothetical protein